jgi:hypothetical protein
MFAGPEAAAGAAAWVALAGVIAGAAPLRGSQKARLWVPLGQTHRQGERPRTAPAVALVEERLAELREIADDEGMPYSHAAEADLRQFLDAAQATARPAAYLLEDGSIRAKWRNLQGEQVGLQFVGGGRAHLVFFVDRGSDGTARIVGQDTVEGALCQVRSLGLLALLRG